MLSADPEQVVRTHGGTRRFPRALRLHAVQHPDKQAPGTLAPSRAGPWRSRTLRIRPL